LGGEAPAEDQEREVEEDVVGTTPHRRTDGEGAAIPSKGTTVARMLRCSLAGVALLSSASPGGDM
jgi:hypothetical protein